MNQMFPVPTNVVHYLTVVHVHRNCKKGKNLIIKYHFIFFQKESFINKYLLRENCVFGYHRFLGNALIERDAHRFIRNLFLFLLFRIQLLSRRATGNWIINFDEIIKKKKYYSFRRNWLFSELLAIISSENEENTSVKHKCAHIAYK